MTETGVRLFDVAAVEAVAAQLNEATERGRRQDRRLRQGVRGEVDQLIRFGPSRLPLTSVVVVLLALAACGAWGFLWGHNGELGGCGSLRSSSDVGSLPPRPGVADAEA